MNVLKAVMQSVTHCYTCFCLTCCSIHECVQASCTERDGALQAHLCCPSGMVLTVIFHLYTYRMVDRHVKINFFDLYTYRMMDRHVRINFFHLYTYRRLDRHVGIKNQKIICTYTGWWTDMSEIISFICTHTGW